MNVTIFCNKAIEAIRLEVKEILITDKFLHKLVVKLRNLVPDLVLNVLAKRDSKVVDNLRL